MSGLKKCLRLSLYASVAIAALAGPANAGQFTFTPGDLVISVYGNGDGSGPYADNAASPITLQEFTTTGTFIGPMTLPQSSSVVNGVTNSPISGEFRSSSEGTLELSGNGQYLTHRGLWRFGHGLQCQSAEFGGGTKTCIGNPNPCYPLAQTASVAGTPGSAGSGVATATVVPRVIALIGANGSVDTSTALTGVFNENNPRSVATVNGSAFYIAGQGPVEDRHHHPGAVLRHPRRHHRQADRHKLRCPHG